MGSRAKLILLCVSGCVAPYWSQMVKSCCQVTCLPLWKLLLPLGAQAEVHREVGLEPAVANPVVFLPPSSWMKSLGAICPSPARVTGIPPERNVHFLLSVAAGPRNQPSPGPPLPQGMWQPSVQRNKSVFMVLSLPPHSALGLGLQMGRPAGCSSDPDPELSSFQIRISFSASLQLGTGCRFLHCLSSP